MQSANPSGCFMRVSLRIAYNENAVFDIAVKLFWILGISGERVEEKDTESGGVREGTPAADSDELEFGKICAGRKQRND